MKRVIGIVLAVGVCVAAVSVFAVLHEPRVLPNVYVGYVRVGGMTAEEARREVRDWWEASKGNAIAVKVIRPSGEVAGTYAIKLSKLGVRLDDKACIEQVPFTNFWSAAWESISHPKHPQREFAMRIAHGKGQLPTAELKSLVEKCIGGRRSATVQFVKGEIIRTPEVAGYAPETEYLTDEVAKVLAGAGPLMVRVHESEKGVPDAELAKITGVVSEFSTHFPGNQANRNGNIRLAAEKINGILLMPGEEFSFNKTVGERTADGGYQLAGIYKNGKHEQGIGGGICQVSGTLYNTALLANLQISSRRNHSMPVAYLPVGRDATVDFGGIDLRFRNSLPAPISISSQFQSGKLTFRILGHPDPSIKVKIITEDHKILPGEIKIVHYDDAPPGEAFVVEKGSPPQSISTYRVVYIDGKEASRELLSKSRYTGAVRIIGKNLKTVSGSSQERSPDKRGKVTQTNGESPQSTSSGTPRSHPLGPPN